MPLYGSLTVTETLTEFRNLLFPLRNCQIHFGIKKHHCAGRNIKRTLNKNVRIATHRPATVYVESHAASTLH